MDTDQNLLEVTKRGEVDKLRSLLDDGANPNIKDDSGSTPLHEAVNHGASEVVELLLKFGADPTAEDNARRIPLHYAAQIGQERIAQMLIGTKTDSEPVSRYKVNY